MLLFNVKLIIVRNNEYTPERPYKVSGDEKMTFWKIHEILQRSLVLGDECFKKGNEGLVRSFSFIPIILQHKGAPL